MKYDYPRDKLLKLKEKIGFAYHDKYIRFEFVKHQYESWLYCTCGNLELVLWADDEKNYYVRSLDNGEVLPSNTCIDTWNDYVNNIIIKKKNLELLKEKI